MIIELENTLISLERWVHIECHTWIRNLTISKKLHEENAVAPHIWLDREFSILNGLRRCPLHREPAQDEVSSKTSTQNFVTWLPGVQSIHCQQSLGQDQSLPPESHLSYVNLWIEVLFALQTLAIKFSPMSTFLAARSLWINPFLSRWAIPLATWKYCQVINQFVHGPKIHLSSNGY